MARLFFGANLALALDKVSVAAMTPLWSLAVEEQFYLFWPCVVLLCRRKTLRGIALAVVIASPLLRALFTPAFATHFPIYSLTIFRADTLAAGAFVALCESEDAQWVKRHGRMALCGTALALALLGLFSFLPSFRTGANGIFFNSVAYSLSVGLFGCTLTYTLGIRHVVAHDVVVHIGDQVRRVIDGAEIAVFSYRQGESVHRVAYELVADNGRTGHGFSLGRSGGTLLL